MSTRKKAGKLRRLTKEDKRIREAKRERSDRVVKRAKRAGIILPDSEETRRFNRER